MEEPEIEIEVGDGGIDQMKFPLKSDVEKAADASGETSTREMNEEVPRDNHQQTHRGSSILTESEDGDSNHQV